MNQKTIEDQTDVPTLQNVLVTEPAVGGDGVKEHQTVLLLLQKIQNALLMNQKTIEDQTDVPTLHNVLVTEPAVSGDGVKETLTVKKRFNYFFYSITF